MEAQHAQVEVTPTSAALYELKTIADRQALHKVEFLKAELLSTVSHELRSPLASIKGYATTLLQHEHRISREERHEFLLAINEASDRLAVVIDHLLEMSQLDTGSIKIEPGSVNLVHLVREAITTAEQRFVASPLSGNPAHVQKRFTFILRLEDAHGRPGGKEPIIQADRHRLRKVLDNLLENAVLYSPEGGTVEVKIRPIGAQSQTDRFHSSADHDESNATKRGFVSPAPESQQMIEICVQDNGISIPREQLEYVFESFHRLDTRLTREVNGLGLGLAICKRIVELHAGAIWAESTVGKGSTFHVWLPVERSE